MSQKRAKLIRKYSKSLGLDRRPGALNSLKRAYSEANWKEKTEAGLEAKEVINLAKQNAENLNRRPQTPTQGSKN